MRARADDERPARFGFTVTKKTGNAVLRNRIRRRLREAVRALPPDAAPPGTDVVLIANAHAARQRFDELVGDLRNALAQARGGGVAKRRVGGQKRRDRRGEQRSAEGSG